MARDILRGRIISMYRSLLNFARAMGWSSRKTYDIVNGKQEATAKDIEDMCKALDVEIPEEMRTLFF
ncbi:MAG: hypothetical protein J6S83_07710 [Lachnospiraceae bacterium]|nr:hypothetical protein [Lachnospiraceae bacterium]